MSDLTAEIVFSKFEAAKFDENFLQLSVGFKFDDGEVRYMRYPLSGASERQIQWAGKELSRLLKSAVGENRYRVRLSEGQRGTDVYADDGFRPEGGGGGEPSGGF